MLNCESTVSVLLGYDPKIDLRDGMQRSVEWMIDQDIRL
jgi:nucleoside-diphosphate-sugar epimerase